MFAFCDFHISGLADWSAVQLVMAMAMSENHLCFRMLYFHRNLVRLLVQCSGMYRDLDTQGYNIALNHTIGFFHVPIGAHTDTIGSM
jgi:hypothetical protein